MKPNGNSSSFDNLTITEIGIGEVPPARRSEGKYKSLYQELCLRLERTSDSMALMLEFDSEALAIAVRISLRKRFKKTRQAIRLQRSGQTVYVWGGAENHNGNGHRVVAGGEASDD